MIALERLSERVILWPGDCLDIMATLPECSIDACVTDPPYGLSFMGKGWDKGVPGVPFWRAVIRVLKPGAHLVTFGGTRTYHRIACAVEDAGFEIRDSLMWIFGTGFPKSHNLNGEWEGFGTALKPAFEPIVLARKPLSEGTVAANVLRWRTGAINIAGCRISTDRTRERQYDCEGASGLTGSDSRAEGYGLKHAPRNDAWLEQGRWPANVVHDGSDEVVGAFPNLGKSSGGGMRRDGQKNNVYGRHTGHEKVVDVGFGDAGSAARFFYSAKASKADRAGSKHPTVKPIALMQWLARLVTPPGGRVLDPFAGSGTTGAACALENLNAILIEREPEYQADIRRRFAPEAPPTIEGLPLFGDHACAQ